MADAHASCKRQRAYDESVAEWFRCDGHKGILEISHQEGNSVLTRGAFGEICIAVDVTSNEWGLAAVKTIPRAVVSSRNSFGSWGRSEEEDAKVTREVFNELVALRMLNPHPCVVPLLGVFKSTRESIPGALSFAFPYHPLDLQMILERQRRMMLPGLSLGVIKAIAKDIMLGVEHCHTNGVLHRDVKPGNLLLTSKGRVQLCDFGLAKPCPSLLKEDALMTLPSCNGNTGSKGLCTLYYRPPEVLLGGPADHPSIDIFAAGLVVSELLTGNPLFCGKNDLDQLGRIFHALGTPSDDNWPDARDFPDYGKVTYPQSAPKPWSSVVPRIAENPLFGDWLSSTVSLDPVNRVSATISLAHTWFTAQPYPSPSEKLADELIPEDFRLKKVLFASRNANKRTLTNAKNYALAAAAKRREFGQEELTTISAENCGQLNHLSMQLKADGFGPANQSL